MTGKLLIALFCLLLFRNQASFFTKKKVWMYWSDNFQQAPDFYRICQYKMRLTCQRQGWNYTLLTNQNLHMYLNNYTAFEEVVGKRKLMYPQNLGDYVKLSIIHDNGGVFFDITSVNFGGLNWLLDLEKDPQKLTNYRKGLQPEVILFYSTFQQSSSEYFEAEQGFKNFLPGYQIFFLAGKQNSKTLKMLIDQFEEMYMKTFEQNVQMIYQDDIFYRNLDFNYYLTTQKSISYTVQKFQQELDNNLTLLSKRKNANQELKIWGVHCQDSTFYSLYYFQDIKFNYDLTIKQLEVLHGVRLKFYTKYIAGGSDFYEVFGKTKQLFKKYGSFQNFLSSNPTKQDCQSQNFVVEGSILGILISQNQIAQNQNILPISVQQRTKWQNYCQGINSFKNKNPSILYTYITKPLLISLDQSHISRLHQHNEDIGLIEMAQDYFLQNRFYLILCGFYYVAFFFGIGVVVGIKKLILLFFNKLLGINIQQNEAVHCSLKNKIFVLFFGLLPPLLYVQVSQFGRYHNQTPILITYVTYILVKKYVFEQRSQEKIFGLTLQQLDRILSSVTYYFILKSLLYSIQNRDEKVIPYAILIGLVFPQILKTAESIVFLNQMKVNFLLRNLVKHSQKIISIFTMNIIVLFIFIPNVKFIKVNGIYATKYISYAILGYIGLFVSLVCSEALKIVTTSLKLFLSKKWEIKKRQVVILMEVTVQLFFICKTLSYHQNFIQWIGNLQKTILQVFLIFVFMPLNLRNCQEFKSVNFSYKRIQNNISDNDFQNVESIENERNLLAKKEYINESLKTKGRSIPFLSRSPVSIFMLTNFLPFLMFTQRWIYKENQYKQQLEYLVIDLLIVFLNCSTILAWKQVSEGPISDQVLIDDESIEKV